MICARVLPISAEKAGTCKTDALLRGREPGHVCADDHRLPVIVMNILDFSKSEASRLYGYMEAILAIGGLVGGIAQASLDES